MAQQKTIITLVNLDQYFGILKHKLQSIIIIMPNQPIKFLLHQLSNNERGRERFEKLWEQKEMSLEVSDFENFLGKGKLANYEIIEFIRTCLSRINNEAVLGVFEGGTKYNQFLEQRKESQIKASKTNLDGEAINPELFGLLPQHSIKGLWQREEIKIHYLWSLFKSNILSFTFNEPLEHGKPLSEAIEALHNKMLELVPEYKEFCKNNK